MTFTLFGRWQTRALLLATVGVAAAFIFGAQNGASDTLLALLGYLFLLGIGWDALYQAVQARRWDRDWPSVFALCGGIVEGAALWGLIRWGAAQGFPSATGLPGVAADFPLSNFFVFYSVTWVVMFLFTQGPLRVVFPSWRFRGGQLWGGDK